MNRSPIKMVNGLMINPNTNKVELVQYDGNYRGCIENLLGTSTNYRMINGVGLEKNKICLFIEHEQDETKKPFSFGDDIFFGKGVIVKLGNHQNEYDFHTKSLSKKLIKELSESISLNLKVNYKIREVIEVESVEFV